jgi:hypothetical protein
MRKINKALIGVIVGATALASAVGYGASAAFTDAVHGSQTINAGTLNLTVTGPGSTSTDGKTITLSPVGPFGSTFTTGSENVTISNVGTVKATGVSLSAAETHGSNPAGAAFAGELGVTVKVGATTVYDGLLSGLVGTPQTISGAINPNDTVVLHVTFYAGSGSVPSLDDAAQGGSVTPTLTVSYSG